MMNTKSAFLEIIIQLRFYNHLIVFFSFPVPGNIHSGVSGNDSIMATGVFSAKELLRVTRCKILLKSL